MTDEVHDTCRQSIKYLIGRYDIDPVMAGHLFGIDTFNRLIRAHEELRGVANREAKADRLERGLDRMMHTTLPPELAVVELKAELARVRNERDEQAEEVDRLKLRITGMLERNEAAKDRVNREDAELGERMGEAVKRAEQAEARAAVAETERQEAIDRAHEWAEMIEEAAAILKDGSVTGPHSIARALKHLEGDETTGGAEPGPLTDPAAAALEGVTKD